MKRSVLTLFVIFCLISALHSQEAANEAKYDFNGYFSAMPSIFWLGKSDPTGNDRPLWQIVGHNRLNFEWYPAEHFTGCIQLRNQVIGGDFVKMANYSSGFKTENYYFPLTYNQTFGNQYLLSLSVDRLWLQYTYNKLEMKIGRQRINWGQTFAWNPNDIFNSYNFFDFDYPERPGADAIRIQYFATATSSFDLAAKIDSSGNISGGGLYRFNRWNTDIQVLGGLLNQSNLTVIPDTIPILNSWDDHDLICGVGFSGAIKSISIRGEASYFYSLKNNADSTNLLLISLGADYSFANQTLLMFEFMFNSNVLMPEGSSFLNFYSGNQSVKTLTYTKYNFFAQAAYPATPLLNVNLGGMYFVDRNLMGYYFGPSADLSLGDNLILSGVFQFFSFKMENQMTGNKEWTNASLVFLRLKWNF